MEPRLEAALHALERRLGGARVQRSAAALMAYECDGTTRVRRRPAAVLMPETRDEAVAAVEILAAHGVSWAPRGAGTGLSGGALASADGVVLSLARLRRILHLDPVGRVARVEPGVVNRDLSQAARPHGLCYAPDPSSQMVCTLGGNLAENAGGPHTLKAGVTTQHVLGATVVLSSGEVVRLGGRGRRAPGLDLTGLFAGSEGTLGAALDIDVRLVPIPPATETIVATFASIDDATHAVSAIIASGVIPAALEMLDAVFLAALNRAFAMNFPLDAAALLLIEVDGLPAAVADELACVRERLERATSVSVAASAEERARLWRARKQAFGAIGRISPAYLTQDGVVPRTRLPEALAGVAEIARRHRLTVANVFHAGDGNLHPCLLFDPGDPDEVERVYVAGDEIMDLCIALGGTVTGEHGIGLDKREALARLYDPASLALADRVRAAWDPLGLANPGKVLPEPGACAEARSLQSRAMRNAP